MPTTTKFCELEDVKAELNMGDGFSGDDTQLTLHIKRATALIRTFTRRSWELGTYTQYFSTNDINIALNSGRNVSRFWLKEKPATSVTTITYNTGGDFANTDPLVEDTHYYVDYDANAIVIYPQYMTSSMRSLKAVYVAGYGVNDTDADLLDVPENLKRACAIQAAFTWKRVLNETQGTVQKQDRKGFVNYGLTSSGLIKDALAMVRGETRTLVGNG